MLARRALLALTIGGALALGSPGAARADVPISQVGWWTRSPSPPAVPEGGISVAAAPDGPLTVGALLLDVGAGGASGTSITIVEGSGSAGGPVAAMQVCPTTTTWAADAGGAMADAPKAVCSGAAVPMERADDGTWTADVQRLVEGRTDQVGLMVVPAGASPPFQLTFAPPTVAGSVSSDSGEDSSSASPTFTPSPSSSPSPTFSSPSSPSFVAPATPTPTVPVVPSDQAATPESDGSSATAAAVPFTPQVGASAPAGARNARVTKVTVVLWYVLALVVGAAVAFLARLRNEGRLDPALLLSRVRR